MAIKPTQVTTGEVRISYEHLLKPYANQPGQEEKYSVTLLIPKSDIATKQRIDAAIQAAMQEGITGKWGGTRPPQPPVPIHDGDSLRPSGDAFGPECKGHWVMTASSQQRQDIVDMSLSPILDATEVYSGMYARIALNFFAYNFSGKKGIGCGLGPVQKTRDGEPLGGRVTAAEAFGGGYAQPVAQQPAQPMYQQPAQPMYQQPAQPVYQQQPSWPNVPLGVETYAVDPVTGELLQPGA